MLDHSSSECKSSCQFFINCLNPDENRDLPLSFKVVLRNILSIPISHDDVPKSGDDVPKSGFFTWCAKSWSTHRAELSVYFMSMQRWVLGGNSTKLAHLSPVLRGLYTVWYTVTWLAITLVVTFDIVLHTACMPWRLGERPPLWSFCFKGHYCYHYNDIIVRVGYFQAACSSSWRVNICFFYLSTVF